MIKRILQRLVEQIDNLWSHILISKSEIMLGWMDLWNKTYQNGLCKCIYIQIIIKNLRSRLICKN